ncbi:MAG: hypothetical protein Q9178_003712 [Gyalolechia marmorata]
MAASYEVGLGTWAMIRKDFRGAFELHFGLVASVIEIDAGPVRICTSLTCKASAKISYESHGRSSLVLTSIEIGCVVTQPPFTLPGIGVIPAAANAVEITLAPEFGVWLTDPDTESAEAVLHGIGLNLDVTGRVVADGEDEATKDEATEDEATEDEDEEKDEEAEEDKDDEDDEDDEGRDGDGLIDEAPSAQA